MLQQIWGTKFLRMKPLPDEICEESSETPDSSLTPAPSLSGYNAQNTSDEPPKDPRMKKTQGQAILKTQTVLAKWAALKTKCGHDGAFVMGLDSKPVADMLFELQARSTDDMLSVYMDGYDPVLCGKQIFLLV